MVKIYRRKDVNASTQSAQCHSSHVPSFLMRGSKALDVTEPGMKEYGLKAEMMHLCRQAVSKESIRDEDVRSYGFESVEKLTFSGWCRRLISVAPE